MNLGFTGEYTQKVDGKGRMSIPADFRRELEAGDPEYNADDDASTPRLYILYGAHLKDTIHLYTVNEFARVAQSIYNMPNSNPNKKRLSHLILGQSTRLDVDKDGRVVMPIKQRQKLGVEAGELFFRGLGDHVEIWKAETFNETVGATINDWLDDMPDDFDPLSLVDMV